MVASCITKEAKINYTRHQAARFMRETKRSSEITIKSTEGEVDSTGSDEDTEETQEDIVDIDNDSAGSEVAYGESEEVGCINMIYYDAYDINI